MKIEIEFKFLDPEFVKKISVAKINKAELYDEEGYPVEGGLMDPRTGSIDPTIRCRTCGNFAGECLGHFGHIELAKPVVHVLYAKLVYYLLKVFCRKCSRILISEEDLKKIKPGSLKEILKNAKSKCPYCNEKQKEIKFLRPHTYFEGEEQLYPDKIRERFEKITNEDLKYIGIKTRPEWFILNILLVPPVTLRPSIILETGERSEDDLTHKLAEIVRVNERLRENIELGSPKFIIEDLWELLQYNVSTYFDNELAGIPPARHRSGKVLKALAQRLKTKEGRFRGNLAGKRVNFSARTVISPDPYLDINEVGVPILIAKELTIPIIVNENNIEEIKKYVLNGPNTWPGANYVIRPDGRRIRITEENKEEVAKSLQPGFVVERHLINGDISLFNRQPSLHRMSMMAHKVRVMPYKTFRLSLNVAPPYNADFDGDEMNLHIPQTEEARAEAEMLMDVEHHIRSPRFSASIIGLRQDFITGLYLLTSTNKKFNREEVIEIVKAIDPRIEIPNKKEFSGKEIFSLFLPKDLKIQFLSKTGEKVVIENGNLIEGVIDKAAIAAESGKLIDYLEAHYGSKFTREFIYKISMLSLHYLMRIGFSIGLDDFELEEDIKNEINKKIEETEKEVNKLIEEFESGKLKPVIGRTTRETLENEIKKNLNKVLGEVSKLISQKVKENNVIKIAKCGARGDIINYVQTVGLIGQETIMGERIARGYKNRVFPHFKEGDISLKAGGFVNKGFKDGLNVFEFFFDAMNSRENLMDKSVKTRTSGYLERRLINALQDLKVEYDFTIRDTEKKIIQFEAFENLLDPSKIRKTDIVEEIAKRLFEK